MIQTPLDQPPTLAGAEFLDTTTSPATFCRLSIVAPCLAIANALSKTFSVSSIANGMRRSAAFSGGVATAPLGSTTCADPDGFQIDFDPDPRIFGGASFQFHLLAEVARTVADIRATAVELHDRNSGCSYRAGSDAG